jgi:hypothetical protein
MEDRSGFCAVRSVVWAFEEVVGFDMMLLVAEVFLAEKWGSRSRSNKVIEPEYFWQ